MIFLPTYNYFTLQTHLFENLRIKFTVGFLWSKINGNKFAVLQMLLVCFSLHNFLLQHWRCKYFLAFQIISDWETESNVLFEIYLSLVLIKSVSENGSYVFASLLSNLDCIGNIKQRHVRWLRNLEDHHHLEASKCQCSSETRVCTEIGSQITANRNRC